jgi:AcrR family transcriptional regulator
MILRSQYGSRGSTPVPAATRKDRISMPTSLRTVRLAGEELDEHRHVAALVDGPNEAEDLLLPFIVEGFEQGDRAFHIVDPALRDRHVERLRESGIDVEAAMAAKQLEVQTWADSYVRAGRFDGSAQLDFIRDVLDEGRSLGYPRTRLIGSTEWAADSATARDLVRYEARVDEFLNTVPDVVVCTYDLTHHTARTIAEVIAAHPVAVVGGLLRTSRGGARETARDRLLTAASKLFHDAGIQATGVDSIIEAAGVAKATFYRHFPSKDDLVLAWLRDPRTRWFERAQARARASGAGPRDEILLFFDAVAEWLESEKYRGCPYLNSSVEITDPAHPARLVIRESLDEIGAYFRTLVAASGYAQPELLAMELHALTAGAISLAVARQTGAYALTAKEAARQLLAEAPLRASG